MHVFAKLRNRTFIVHFSEDDAVKMLRINERVVRNPGHPFLERIVNKPYWHSKHHKKSDTITLIEMEARKQLALKE